jgi:hypothetical protein
MKTLLALILAALCGQAGAADQNPKLSVVTDYRPDFVYIYESTGNRSFQCSAFAAYFETTGYSYFFADNCLQTGQDGDDWPTFPPERIYVSMDFASTKTQDIQQYCRFVGHAVRPPTTSTVLDCRD